MPLTAGVCSTPGSQRPTWGEIYQLARADAQHRMQAGLSEERQTGIRTQAPIRHQHIPWWYARIDRLRLGHVVSNEGCSHAFQEQAGAGMEQSQQARHGDAPPRPLPHRLRERILQRWGISPRAPERSTKKIQ